MSQQEAVIKYQPHPGQAEVHASRARFRIVRAGARWGKTKLGIYEAFWILGKPRAKVWWVSPSWAETLVAWNMFFEEIPNLLMLNVDRTFHTVEMVNRSRITFKSAEDFQHLRAEGLDLVVVDEAARMKREAWFECLRPRLSDSDRMGKALFLSTPSGINWFYELYMLGNLEGSDWECFHYPTWTNPYIRGDEIESARREMPEALFRQEYGAEFLSDLGSIFRLRRDAENKLLNVKGSLEHPKPGGEYVAGVDLGKRTSFTVVGVFERGSGHMVAFDRFKEVDWPLQVKRVTNLAREYNAEIFCDSTGIGDPIFDFLIREYSRVKPVQIGGTHKKLMLIDNLALMIEQVEVTWPDIPEILSEIQVFGIQQGRSGVRRYEAPKGFSDDIVMGFALAAWGLKRKGSGPSFGVLEW